MEELARAVEGLLDEFYCAAGVDWRQALEGEALALDAAVEGAEGNTEAVTFLADAVRQVAPPKPFNAVRCARALKLAIDYQAKA